MRQAIVTHFAACLSGLLAGIVIMSQVQSMPGSFTADVSASPYQFAVGDAGTVVAHLDRCCVVGDVHFDVGGTGVLVGVLVGVNVLVGELANTVPFWLFQPMTMRWPRSFGVVPPSTSSSHS